MYCTVPSAGEGAVWVEGGRGEGVNLMEEKRKWGTPPGGKGTTSVKSPGTQTFKSTGSSKAEL